jgi:hypothetical protein
MISKNKILIGIVISDIIVTYRKLFKGHITLFSERRGKINYRCEGIDFIISDSTGCRLDEKSGDTFLPLDFLSTVKGCSANDSFNHHA